MASGRPRSAKSVGLGVAVFEVGERGEFGAVEFVDAFGDVVGEMKARKICCQVLKRASI